MPKYSYTFAYQVERCSPYTDQTDPPLDWQGEAWMAFVNCVAKNPSKAFHLKDDELIYFVDHRGQGWSIFLAGGNDLTINNTIILCQQHSSNLMQPQKNTQKLLNYLQKLSLTSMLALILNLKSILNKLLFKSLGKPTFLV